MQEQVRTINLKLIVMVVTMIVKISGTDVLEHVNQIRVNIYQFFNYSTILAYVNYKFNPSNHYQIIRNRQILGSMHLKTLVGQAFFHKFKTYLRFWNAYNR